MSKKIEASSAGLCRYTRRNNISHYFLNMAKGSKLKQALDRYKNVDHKLDKQHKQEKAAEKRKRSKTENEDEDAILENAVAEAEEKTLPKTAGKDKRSAKKAKIDAVEEVESAEEIVEDEGWETDEAEENTLAVRHSYDLSAVIAKLTKHLAEQPCKISRGYIGFRRVRRRGRDQRRK